ncbi:MAG TPA: ABC transporter permease [Fimbriimonadaceae bacterium]|nr:ABC transporter permease [Fimbriimonadaceae bacterium]
MRRAPSWIWALVLLAAILLFNLLFTPGFFHFEVRNGHLYGSLVDILNRSAPVALLSLGMTLVIATGGIDLSVGAVMAISGAVAACLIARPQDSPLGGINLHGSIPLIILFAVGFSLICGLFNGILVAFLELQPIVATLLLMVAGRGIAQLLANGQIVTFHSPGFSSIATGAWLMMPNPVWLVVAGLILFGVLTRRTAFGLFVEATGSNPTAARVAGLNAKGIKIAVYTLSAIAAGVAGLIGCADIQGADANNAGLYLELDAILAVSVGGTALTGGRFSLIGSIVGALLMQSLSTTILTRGVSPELTLVLKAIVVVAVCLLQSPAFRQIFAKRAAV